MIKNDEQLKKAKEAAITPYNSLILQAFVFTVLCVLRWNIRYKKVIV